jgi:hypothetical protein
MDFVRILHVSMLVLILPIKKSFVFFKRSRFTNVMCLFQDNAFNTPFLAFSHIRFCDMFSSYKMRCIILLRKVGVIVFLSELYIKVLCVVKYTSLIILANNQLERCLQHSKSNIDHWLESHHTVNGLAMCNKDKKWMITICGLNTRHFHTIH